MSVLPGRVAYMISKFGMTMLAQGMAAEVAQHGVAVNALWPKTIIESQASINFGLGNRGLWRKADIMADATYEIVKHQPSKYQGQALPNATGVCTTKVAGTPTCSSTDWRTEFGPIFSF